MTIFLTEFYVKHQNALCRMEQQRAFFLQINPFENVSIRKMQRHIINKNESIYINKIFKK